MALNLEKIIDAASKTGFKLEYEIGVQLKNNGWHLISNRCYADDLEGKVREIDILAYKVSKVDEISVYTVVIVSCKKSEANSWALFSRPVAQNDPNYDWKPFKGWCNHPAFKFYLKQGSWPEQYHELVGNECPEILSQPRSDVFAFQEISKTNYSVQNDKNIFSAITSLMKAQAYELSLLNERKGNEKCLYQFNLLSVVDSDLVNVKFDGGRVDASLVDQEDYICRYIISGKEENSRIRFVTANHFKDAILSYGKLHQKNVLKFRELYDNFYIDCYKDTKKIALLLPDFLKQAKPAVQRAFFRLRLWPKSFSDLTISWYEPNLSLTVGVISDDLSLGDIERLDADKTLKNELEKILKYIFNYSNSFNIETDILF